MKQIVLICLFILSLNKSHAQPFDWIWAQRYGSYNSEFPGRSAIDSKGNIYIVGSFAGDSLRLGTTTLIRKSKTNFFIVKLNPAGVVQWAKSTGTTEPSSYQEGVSISIDPLDNIYVCGVFNRADNHFSTSIVFENIELTSPAFNNAFLAKYDTSGKVIWAQKKSGHYLMQASALQTDQYGTIYLAGIKSSDTTDLDNYIGVKNMYLDAYKPTGELNYSKTFTGAGNAYTMSIKDSSIYVGGLFSGSKFIIGDTLLNTNVNNFDGFVSKMDLKATVEWARSIKGKGSESVTSSCIDSKGNLCVTGSYGWEDYAVFGTDTIFNKTGAFEFDLFVAKYDSHGKLSWVRNTEGKGSRWGYDLTINPTDDLYVAGGFFHTLYFNGDTLSTVKNASASADVLILKYDKQGTPQWVKTFHGESYEDAKTITYEPHSGNFILLGEFQSDTLTIGKNTFVNSGPISNIDLFVTTFRDEIITSINADSKIKDEDYLLIPNPASNQFHIWTADKQSIVNEITIFNMHGEIVYTKKGNCDISVSVNEWAEGIYMVYIRTGYDYRVKKLVVQK